MAVEDVEVVVDLRHPPEENRESSQISGRVLWIHAAIASASAMYRSLDLFVRRVQQRDARRRARGRWPLAGAQRVIRRPEDVRIVLQLSGKSSAKMRVDGVEQRRLAAVLIVDACACSAPRGEQLSA